MIRKHTLLILGAGASMDYGFPSGKQLIRDIINFLHGTLFSLQPIKKKFSVALVLQRYYKEQLGTQKTLPYCLEKVETFINALIQASPASIDDFIDKNREEGFDIIGKICIVLCISRYEKADEPFFIQETVTASSHHYYHDSLDHRHWEVREGWYGHLWNKIYEGDDINAINANLNKLTFITFNYDRSLEYFLYTTFRNMLGKTSEEAAKLFNENIFIYHVYGQLGHLGWQNQGSIKNDYKRLTLEPLLGGTKEADFSSDSQLMQGRITMSGLETHLDSILSLAKEIKTYTEAARADMTLISGRASPAEVVFFLGFGYHSQNLEWLQKAKVSSIKKTSVTVGTTYGLGKLQTERIAKDLRKVYSFSNVSYIDAEFTALNIRDYFSNVYDIQ